MSDTPKCDAAENKEAWKDPNQWLTELQVSWGLARQLERELADEVRTARALQGELDRLNAPRPEERARDDALEEAAKACENIYAGDEAAGDWPTPEQCAAAVRKLKNRGST